VYFVLVMVKRTRAATLGERLARSARRIREKERQTACKPGSVPAMGGGWPFLLGGCYQPPRATDPDGGPETGPPRLVRGFGAVPTWSCSRWGLPCRPRCRGRGALLPHPFTLAGTAPVALGRRPWAGGLLSVALSLGSPPPAVNRHLVSVEPGLSSPRAGPEGRPSGHLAQLT